MIAGRYDPLADGLAHDTELGRTVRIRWIESTDEVDDPRLSHPNVVRVFDVGEHEGRRFAAIEHVHGLPLSMLHDLPQLEAVQLGLMACRALDVAHDFGLVHAGEVLVRDDGVPKLSGFRRGAPGDDVRTLAQWLNDASPGLPPLTATTTTELARELERARPTAPAPTLRLTPIRTRRRVPVPVVLALVALLAIGGGLAAALAHHGGGAKPQTTTRVEEIASVPRAATAKQEAANLAAWLSRYSR